MSGICHTWQMFWTKRWPGLDLEDTSYIFFVPFFVITHQICFFSWWNQMLTCLFFHWKFSAFTRHRKHNRKPQWMLDFHLRDICILHILHFSYKTVSSLVTDWLRPFLAMFQLKRNNCQDQNDTEFKFRSRFREGFKKRLWLSGARCKTNNYMVRPGYRLEGDVK